MMLHPTAHGIFFRSLCAKMIGFVCSTMKNIGLTATLNRGFGKGNGKIYCSYGCRWYFSQPFFVAISVSRRTSRNFPLLRATEMIDESGNFFVFLSQLEESALQKRLEKNVVFSILLSFSKSDISIREKFLYAQDYDLYTRILTSGKRISCLSDLLLKYRVRKTSLVFSNGTPKTLLPKSDRIFSYASRRKNTDEYDAFNPHDILALDPTSSLDPVVMMTNMKAFFAISDFSEVFLERMLLVFHYTWLQTSVFFLSFGSSVFRTSF